MPGTRTCNRVASLKPGGPGSRAGGRTGAGARTGAGGKTGAGTGSGPRRPPPRRPWTPRQLGTRIAAIFLAGVLIVVLHFTGLLDTLQRRVLPERINWNNDYAVVEHLRDRVVRDGLTHDAGACLLFIINGNDPAEAQRFRVMEKHNARCPGTHGELPLLFTLRVDRSRGAVEDDQGSPGQFHPLPD